MKKYVLISMKLLFSVISFAQQASEIDSKFVRLPRYTNLTAIQSAIPTAQQGMAIRYSNGRKIQSKTDFSEHKIQRLSLTK